MSRRVGWRGCQKVEQFVDPSSATGRIPFEYAPNSINVNPLKKSFWHGDVSRPDSRRYHRHVREGGTPRSRLESNAPCSKMKSAIRLAAPMETNSCVGRFSNRDATHSALGHTPSRYPKTQASACRGCSGASNQSPSSIRCRWAIARRTSRFFARIGNRTHTFSLPSSRCGKKCMVDSNLRR